VRLSALLPEAAFPSDLDRPVAGVSEDSRRIAPGWVFVAMPGVTTDGHLFAADAVRRGAVAVVAERPLSLPDGVPVVTVPSSRAALAELAELQSRLVRAVGVTGIAHVRIQSAFDQLSATTSNLVTARGTIGGCHAALAEAKQFVPGLRTVAFGDGDQCPKVAQADLRIVA
jgi:UDP-N-acetylmuramoyl-L-alanyl-D-glutamate--2,6-diaminopimelate ligase